MERLDTLSSQISFATDGSQYLTFRLRDEEYGVEILKVQEIKGYTAITPVPNTPAYLKGVMNLRGTIVPVVDLRAKFGMEAAEYTAFTVIILLRWTRDGADRGRGVGGEHSKRTCTTAGLRRRWTRGHHGWRGGDKLCASGPRPGSRRSSLVRSRASTSGGAAPPGPRRMR